MAHSIRIEVEELDGAAVCTTEWIRSFHPEVTVAIEGRSVRLASKDRDEAGLRLVWLTTLANERLLAKGAVQRAAIFAKLTR